MHSGYSPEDVEKPPPVPSQQWDLTPSAVAASTATIHIILAVISLGVAGLVIVVFLYIVMSAARKTPSPVAPDTALPKRSKKVRLEKAT